MSADPLDSILYVVAGISIASGMPHPGTLKHQSGFLFFWYSWLFSACQAFAQNAGRIPQIGGIQHAVTDTTDARGNATHREATTAVAVTPTPKE